MPPSPQHPRLSVLIPNFNNGKQSSRDGQTDLLGQLLQSLHDTLAEDPTPLEILAWDDGSTDDSLHTLRQWASHTWRGGQPFLKLTEANHCGVLSITANRLVEQSSGEIFARLDGDTRILTPRWAEKLCAVFDAAPPGLGVVGPKQLRPDGRIHAFGDWLIHPKGYHHIAAGLPDEAADQPLEVDHVMGCFYCCRREVYDRLGGFDEQMLRGQTVDFGLRARLAGYRCIAVPHIRYIHAHSQRQPRATGADSQEGISSTLDHFRQKWGFDRICPDLDQVRQRYASTPLLWNPPAFCPPDQASDATETPMPMEQSAWQRYSADETVRRTLDKQVALTEQVHRQAGEPEGVAIVGCGEGVLPHLLARKGFQCVGVDPSRPAIELARLCAARSDYPHQPPVFHWQDQPGRLPLDDHEAGIVLLHHALETHPNPVGLLRDARRIARDNACLIIVAQGQAAETWTAPAARAYRPHELLSQISYCDGWQPASQPMAERERGPILLVARAKPLQHAKTTAQHTPEPAIAG